MATGAFDIATLEMTNFIHEILRENKNNEYLVRLSTTEPRLFDPRVVNAIMELGKKNEYNIFDLINFNLVMDLNVFKIFQDETDASVLIQHEAILDEYFKAICKKYPNQSYVTIKTRILTIIKVKIIIPANTINLSTGGQRVTINSSYKINQSMPVTNPIDVRKIIRDHFYSAVAEAPTETFVYTPNPMKVAIKGPFLEKIITNFLLLQVLIDNKAKSLGIQMKPFIAKTAYDVLNGGRNEEESD